MNVINNGFAKIWFEDDILRVEFLKEHYDFDMADQCIKDRREFTGERKILMLSDMRNVKSATREARQRVSLPDSAEGCIAVAVLVRSKVQETIFNFFSSIYKEPSPTKLFTDIEKAKIWLLKHKV